MKWFSICIIDRDKFRKKAGTAACAFLSVMTAAGLCLACYSSPKTAAVFSPQDVIEEGVPHEDEPFDLKGLINDILGFDTSRPETIIQSASEIRPDESSTFTEPPEKTEQPVSEQTPPPVMNAALPSHDEIVSVRGLKINNATHYSVDLDSLLTSPPETHLSLTSEPEVLIMHTHTTECYIGDEMSGESERTTNEDYNVCAVADVLCESLESYGIHTIHDKTIHDYPSFQGAYSRALDTITADLEKYPSIKVVIDLHRDAYVYPDGTKLRVAADVGGRTAAQAMLVLGTDSMGLYHPYWRANLSLAAKIQSAAQIMYPGMMRPVNLRRERFNMHVTKGSILIEVGSNGNTLNEAKTTAEFLGKAVAAALING